MDLPYGENPHQRAAFYTQVGARRGVLTRVRQLHGKQLSFNNILDLDGARSVLAEIAGERPACVIVKHNNPCGAALGDRGRGRLPQGVRRRPRQRVRRHHRAQHAGRPRARRRRSRSSSSKCSSPPGTTTTRSPCSPRSRTCASSRTRSAAASATPTSTSARSTAGCSSRTATSSSPTAPSCEVVTERQPTEAQWRDLLFAWRLCRHVKSNAIVVAEDEATLGIGAGQMSRVDSVKIAMSREWVQGRDGLVLASDAFFPFADGPERSARRRRQGAHPARRLDPGRRGRRRGERARGRHGLHQAPPFPALAVRGSRGAGAARLRGAVASPRHPLGVRPQASTISRSTGVWGGGSVTLCCPRAGRGPASRTSGRRRCLRRRGAFGFRRGSRRRCRSMGCGRTPCGRRR